jgi:hypothetical protein
MAEKKRTKNFLKGIKKGALHRDLGIPEDQPIPRERLEAAKNSKDPAVRRRATLALNMRGWHHHTGSEKKRHHTAKEARRAMYGEKAA